MSAEANSLIQVALDRADFQLDFRFEGDIASLVLFGPSGSGKTTLLRALLGLEPSARSRIRIGGEWLEDVENDLRVPRHRRRLGWVPQSPLLFPDRSVRDNIRFAASGDEAAPHIERAIEVLELRPLLETRPHELSGGEQQRVAIARALASRPRALLMDEPLASLDLTLRGRVLPFLLRLREELDVPLVHITHDPDEAILLGDEIVVLDAGRIVSRGDPRETLWSRAVLPLATQFGVENVLAALGSRERSEEARAGGAGPSPHASTTKGLDLEIPWPVENEESLTLGIRAEDILIGLDRPGRLSARNVLSGRIDRIESVDERCLVHVEVGRERLVASVTPGAVEDLGLRPETKVYLIIKSQAIRRI